MGVYYESTGFGDVRTRAVHGRPGVGISELAFSIEWSIHPIRDDGRVLTVFGTNAWIYVHPEGEDSPQFVGCALPESAWREETRTHPVTQQVLYRLVVPQSQLLAIEELRAGRPLIFSIDVRGNSHGPHGIRNFDDKHQLRVNPSDWADMLRGANVADILLVGVHLPMSDSSTRFRPALELVREANRQLMLGHFTPAVAECRRAIESLMDAADLQKQVKVARKSFGNFEKTMSKRERELVLGEAIRNFCHIAHHVGASGEPEVFGRADAALAVGATAALVSSLAADPDLGLADAQKTVNS